MVHPEVLLIYSLYSNVRHGGTVRMQDIAKRVINERSGATAIEYALIAAILSLVAITGFSTMSNSVQGAYENQGAVVDQTRARYE